MEDIKHLIEFLAHQPHGVTELHFAPFGEESEPRIGYFDSTDRLLAAIEDYSPIGRLSVGVQPRPMGLVQRAVNKLRPRVEAAIDSDITHFMTALVNVFYEDDGEADSSTVAANMLQRVGGKVLCWRVPDSSCQLLFAVPPISIQNREDLQDQLTQYGARLQAAQEREGAQITAQAALTGFIVLNGGTLMHNTPRVELPKLGAILHRAIPPVVMRLLNQARGGRAAKLFRGEGAIGVDTYGNDIDTTAVNYDRAFIDHLITKVKGVTREELASALWNRPGCAAKAGGIDAVYAVVDAATDAAKEVQPAAQAQQQQQQPQRRGRPQRPPATYPPDMSLADRIYDDYIEFSDRAQRYVQRVDVEVSRKADKVVQFLIDQGAEFYHFKTSLETVFVLDGIQYSVDVRDPMYQTWFTSNVQLFGPQSPRGRELTSAVRVAIEMNERCHKPDSSKWGHFDREAGILYFCFDPEHADIVRIRPAEGGGPRVDVVPNGTDGVTLRGPLGRGTKFEYSQGALREGFALFKRDVYEGQALNERERLMSMCFNMSTLLPDLRQRPIKFHRGPSGSGKTYAGYDWQICIYGRRYSSEYRDIPSLLHAIKHAGAFITQDNAESSIRRRFEQVYLVASTGSTHTLRKYYTESSHVVFEPNGTLCLSAIEPMTKSEEIRRAFEFGFSAEFHTSDRETPTSREIRLQRNADLMLSALCEVFSVYVLPDWEQRYNEGVAFIRAECPNTSKSAFIDWLGWMFHMCDSVGKYLWNAKRGGQGFDAQTIFKQYLTEMSTSERSARVEGDKALSCLETLKWEGVNVISEKFHDYDHNARHTYIHSVRVERQTTGTVVIGPVTTSQLFKAFSGVSKSSGIRFPYEHGRALGARLSALSEDPAFAEMGWAREQLPGRAHGNNYRYVYTWTPEHPIEPTPKPEVDLTVPDGAGAADDDFSDVVWDTEDA